MIEESLSKVLIDAATSSAVDVVTQRTIKPELKRIGQAYRVYSILKPTYEISQAFRIAAYSDAAGILAHEIIVQIVAKKVSEKFSPLDVINYEVHKQAEGLLFKPDFESPTIVDTRYLRSCMFDQEFGEREINEMGAPLIQLGYDCILRGIRAHSTVNDLLSYPETLKQRRTRFWGRPNNIFDKINEISGFVFWQPVPEVGLGSGRITNSSEYSGIFRRDIAEGYGRVIQDDGVQWYGQIRDSWPTNYGVRIYPDGRLFIGYETNHSLHLGVTVSANKDKIIFGGHDFRGIPHGYARQIGIRNGIDSQSGLWLDGELKHPFPFIAQTMQEIVESMNTSFLANARAEYQQKADAATAIQNRNDQKIVSAVTDFL